MRTTRTTLMMGALAVLVVAVPLVAHHTFGAEFDVNAPIQLEGTVVRLEWTNPHVWIHVEVSRMVQGTTEIVPDDPSEDPPRVRCAFQRVVDEHLSFDLCESQVPSSHRTARPSRPSFTAWASTRGTASVQRRRRRAIRT